MPPLVSIVITTHNRSALLERALASARAQTYPKTEVVVVDDGSTDDTLQVVKRSGPGVRLVQQQNLGCAAAKNAGLAASSGDLITNLDDDDQYQPHKVERQVEVFLRQPAVGICATGAHFVDPSGQILRTQVPPDYPPATRLLHLLRFCPFVQSSVMIRRECHDRLGGYRLTFGEDYDFWLRACLYYDVAVLVEPLTLHLRHNSQMTSPEHNRAYEAGVRGVLMDFLRDLSAERICPLLPVEEVYATVGAILIGRKFYPEADGFLQRALPSSSAHFWLGMLAVRDGDPERAADFLTRVAAASPLAPMAFELLASFVRHAGAPDEPGLRDEVRRVFHLALQAQLAPLEAHVEPV